MNPSSTTRHRPTSRTIVNADHAAHPRQQALTGALRCYYDDARHRQLRPHCEGVAVVAYGPTRLCAACDAMRSSVGKGTAATPVPGAELARLIDAARAAADADHHLARRRPRRPPRRRLLDPDRRRRRPHPPSRPTTLGTPMTRPHAADVQQSPTPGRPPADPENQPSEPPPNPGRFSEFLGRRPQCGGDGCVRGGCCGRRGWGGRGSPGTRRVRRSWRPAGPGWRRTASGGRPWRRSGRSPVGDRHHRRLIGLAGVRLQVGRRVAGMRGERPHRRAGRGQPPCSSSMNSRLASFD